MGGAPVIIRWGALYKDDNSSEVFAKLNIQSLSDNILLPILFVELLYESSLREYDLTIVLFSKNVKDAINKASKKLEQYEEKLHFLAKIDALQIQLDSIKGRKK